jgi:hypothetical protein
MEIPQNVAVVLAVKDDLTGWRFDLNLQRNARSEVNLQLTNALNIIGTVSTMDGAQPLVAAVVETIATASGIRTNLSAISVSTDKAGGFKFLNLRPGQYRLRCMTDSGYVGPVGAETVELAENGKPATVQLPTLA